MKCVIVYQPGHSENVKNELEKTLLKLAWKVQSLAYADGITGHQIYQSILEAGPDLVFTIDLTGFNMKTDTDDIAYINLTCPNIHFISGNLEPGRFACLGGKLSIAMFFYCLGRETYDDLMERYPGIPYLAFVADCEAGVRDVMEEIL